MHKYLFCVHDRAAGAYMDPFSAPSVQYAQREFGRLANKEGHPFAEFPSDYTLFLIGKFLVDSGRVESPDMITSLGNALDYLDGGV